MHEFSEKREELKRFFYKIRECKNCKLSETRTNFVFGSGNAESRIMFIGEAPGRNEDLQGRPFVGQAGKILDELLALIGFERAEIFIANVLKCRPPQNREPQLAEVNSCKDYLFKQIEIIDPKIICTLGRHSTQLLLNTDKSISGLRGRVFKINWRYVMPINHPAAALYTPSRMEVLKGDFIRLGQVIQIIDGKIPKNSLLIEDFFSKKEKVKPDIISEKDDNNNNNNDNNNNNNDNNNNNNNDNSKNSDKYNNNDNNGTSDQMGLF